MFQVHLYIYPLLELEMPQIRLFGYCLTALLMVFAPTAIANSPNGSNAIISVGIHDSGHALVLLETSTNTEGCATPSLKNYIVIANTNPNFKAMYATALLALSTGKPVEGWVNGCTDLFGSKAVTATTLFISR